MTGHTLQALDLWIKRTSRVRDLLKEELARPIKPEELGARLLNRDRLLSKLNHLLAHPALRSPPPNHH